MDLGRVETTCCDTGARVHMIAPHVRLQLGRPELEITSLEQKGADGQDLRALVSIKVVAKHARRAPLSWCKNREAAFRICRPTR